MTKANCNHKMIIFPDAALPAVCELGANCIDYTHESQLKATEPTRAAVPTFELVNILVGTGTKVHIAEKYDSGSIDSLCGAGNGNFRSYKMETPAKADCSRCIRTLGQE
jgi:hypothetical protein